MKNVRRIADQRRRGETPIRPDDDRPVRLAHVLFVLWAVGSVAWALYAAQLAHGYGWWLSRPVSAGVLVLAPPVLIEILALLAIRIAGNPRLW